MIRRQSNARDHVDDLGRRSRQAAMFVAAATVPRTLQPALLPRSNRDQGIITGVAVMANYAIGNALHDAIEAVGRRAVQRDDRNDPRRRRAAGAVNVAAVVLGAGVSFAFPRRHHERLGRAALRTVGAYTAWTGFAGMAVVALQETLALLDQRTGNRYNLRALPVAIPAGAALSTAVEFARRRRAGDDPLSEHSAPQFDLGRSLLLGGAVAGALAAVGTAESTAALALQHAIARRWPAYSRAARPLGHALTLGTLSAVAYAGVRYAFAKIESGAAQPEQGYNHPPPSALSSGGPGSLVDFHSLSQYPRRFVLGSIHPKRIQSVMGEPARGEPIRLYVGLDSAPTVDGRVKLALDEIERTGALDRALLLLISPTGTGWIDPNMVEAAEYFTRGDIASVAIQYSKRPSALSLDRVALGRAQNSMLWAAIHQRLYERPRERRPRVVLFGESLGAHCSQDVFIHRGTTGLRSLDIEAALWFGTPYASRWKAEVLDERRADVDRTMVGVFDHFEQLEQLSEEQRAKLRYIMLSHENDAVTYFGLDLLVRSPDWLADRRPAVVPRTTRWFPVTTFLQTAIDMKNAMNVVPGEFAARGHDYRADTARFVMAAFRLAASDTQLASVERALRRMEKVEGEWTAAHLVEGPRSKVEGHTQDGGA